MGIRRVTGMALLIGFLVLGAAPALAHGGGAGGGLRGGMAAFRGAHPFVIRRAAPFWRIPHRGWNGWRHGDAWNGRAWNGGARNGGAWNSGGLAPLTVLPPDPAVYAGPEPPVVRTCLSETRLVPSSRHPGLTPVSVTRCWRRY